MADEYFLTHKNTFEECGSNQVSGSVRKGKHLGDSRLSKLALSSGRHDDPKVCCYCQRKGHWKNDCPALKAMGKFSGGAQIKPAALAAPFGSPAQLVVQTEGASDNRCPDDWELKSKGDYSAFISEGYVSLSEEEAVPITILRDTGALDSYVHEAVFRFSLDSNTSNFILMQGMGMNIIPVPLHTMKLVCGLVSGEVLVGARPELAVDGIDMVLGSDLAGNKVCADAPPANVAPPSSLYYNHSL